MAARWLWWLSLPALLVVGWIAGFAAFGPFTADFTAQHLAYRTLPPAAGAWAVLTLALCIGIQIARAKSARASARDRG